MKKTIQFTEDYSIYKKGDTFTNSEALTRMVVSKGKAKYVEDKPKVEVKKPAVKKSKPKK